MNSVVKKVNVCGWFLAILPLAVVPISVIFGGVVGYILTPFAVPLLATMCLLVVQPAIKEGVSDLWLSMIRASLFTGFVMMIVVGIEGYVFEQWTLILILPAAIIYYAVSFVLQISLMLFPKTT